MRKPFRRFELLLPTRFNDGLAVPDDASETQTIEGQWRHEGRVYRDESVSIFVDVPDTNENQEFFIGFKEILKKRFQQLDIWMTTFPLEVL